MAEWSVDSCPKCDGDGGYEVPYVIGWSFWCKCGLCGGTGLDPDVSAEPVDLDRLEQLEREQ